LEETNDIHNALEAMPPGKNRRNPRRSNRIGRSPVDRSPQLSTARRRNDGMRLQRCSYRGCPPTFDLRHVAREFGGSCTCTRNKFRSSNTLRCRRRRWARGNGSCGVPLSPRRSRRSSCGGLSFSHEVRDLDPSGESPLLFSPGLHRCSRASWIKRGMSPLHFCTIN